MTRFTIGTISSMSYGIFNKPWKAHDLVMKENRLEKENNKVVTFRTSRHIDWDEGNTGVVEVSQSGLKKRVS